MNDVGTTLMAVAYLSSLAPAPAAGVAPVRIVATEQGFETPRSIDAGLRHVVFENRGKYIHEAMFIKLPSGMSAHEFVARVRAGSLFPEGALDYSGPGLTSPGETSELWLKLDPGEYVLICWNHSKNSVHEVSVRQTGQPDDIPPKEDVVLRLRDFRFDLEGQLKPGTQVIRVETPGPSMHEVDLFRLRKGHTAVDVQRWYKKGLGNPAPADAMGGVLDSHDIERVVWLRKALSPGRYVLHCAMPMTLDAKAGDHGPIHSDVGMIITLEIGK